MRVSQKKSNFGAWFVVFQCAEWIHVKKVHRPARFWINARLPCSVLIPRFEVTNSETAGFSRLYRELLKGGQISMDEISWIVALGNEMEIRRDLDVSWFKLNNLTIRCSPHNETQFHPIRATARWGEHPISGAESFCLLFKSNMPSNESFKTKASPKILSGPMSILIYPR